MLFKVVTLVDFSAFCYRCKITKFPNLPELGELPKAEQWRYIFLTSLRKLFRDWDNVIFVRDSKPERKLQIDPTYKHARTQIDHSEIQEACAPVIAYLPAIYASAVGEEADDVVCSLATKLSAEYEITILSPDRDLWQMASLPGCSVYDTNKKSQVNDEMSMKAFGVKLAKIALYKAWLGDDGDCVPRISKMPKKLAIEALIEPFGDVESFIAVVNTDESVRCTYQESLGKWFDKVNEFCGRAKQNWDLVKLKPDLSIDITDWNVGSNLNQLQHSVGSVYQSHPELVDEVYHKAINNVNSVQSEVLPDIYGA